MISISNIKNHCEAIRQFNILLLFSNNKDFILKCFSLIYESTSLPLQSKKVLITKSNNNERNKEK